MSILSEPLFVRFFDSNYLPEIIFKKTNTVYVDSVAELRDLLNSINTNIESVDISDYNSRYDDTDGIYNSHMFTVSHDVDFSVEERTATYAKAMREFEHSVWLKVSKHIADLDQTIKQCERYITEIDQKIPHMQNRVAKPATNEQEMLILRKTVECNSKASSQEDRAY